MEWGEAYFIARLQAECFGEVRLERNRRTFGVIVKRSDRSAEIERFVSDQVRRLYRRTWWYQFLHDEDTGLFHSTHLSERGADEGAGVKNIHFSGLDETLGEQQIKRGYGFMMHATDHSLNAGREERNINRVFRHEIGRASCRERVFGYV